jgi:general transcription factor 3C polypeptide 1
VCDLLLRLPLCIFVKVYNITFIVPELEQYLLHPIRRHYLVRHLPSRLRNILTIARRYIFSVHDVLQRLCYVGLIQFGPQRFKEKDQVLLCRRNQLTFYTQLKDSLKDIV